MLKALALQKQCIWITRPAHQAIELKDKITDMGGQYIHIPAMTIDWLACTITQPPASKKVYAIFTSCNAVPSAAQALQSLPCNTINLAVGPATATAMQAHGLQVDQQAPEPYGTEALLSMPLWSSLEPTHSHIMIFTGKNCSHKLQQGLQQRHFQPHSHACYQRSCPDTTLDQTLSGAQRQQITIIISTSCDLLKNLWHMTPATWHTWLRQTPLVVISHTMAQQAKQLGFVSIYQADNASTDTIVACLSQLPLKTKASKSQPHKHLYASSS
jgi:uroporphyrinogen-III synthase